jgi:hypothetical protein
MEALVLLGLLLFLAFIVGVFVLPIIALVRTQRLGEIIQRLGHLEWQVAQLRRAASRPGPAEEIPTVEPVTSEQVTEKPPPPAREPVTVPPPRPSPSVPDSSAAQDFAVRQDARLLIVDGGALK